MPSKPSVNSARKELSPTTYRNLTVGFTFLLALFSLLAALAEGLWAVLWQIEGFLAAIALAATSLSKSWAEDRALRSAQSAQADIADQLDAERSRILVTTNGALQRSGRVLELMAGMSQAERALKLAEAQKEIVSNACDLVKCDKPRASYFRVVPGSNPRQMSHVVSDSRERTDESSSLFTEGGDDDQDVWEILNTGGDRFVPDSIKNPPMGFDKEKPRAYATYITVAVTAGIVPMGILTINAPTPGELADVDVASMRVLARLMGAVEALGVGTTKMNRRKELEIIRRANAGGESTIEIVGTGQERQS